MGVKITIKTDKLKSMQKATEQLTGKNVEVGIFGGEEAWLAGIHEYGCNIKVTPKMRAYLHTQGLHLKESTEYIKIPERAFMRNGFDSNKEEINKRIDQLLPIALDGNMPIEQFLSAIGLIVSSKIKDFATQSKLPNHPFTIEKKGSSKPLVNTGSMIGAITYRTKE